LSFLPSLRESWHGNGHGQSEGVVSLADGAMVSFILILLTLAVLVVLQLSRTDTGAVREHLYRRPRKASSHDIVERYFHPAHSWVLIDSSESVLVGVDDFAQRMIGAIETIELPPLGRQLTQGEVLATLRRGRKALTSVAPVAGVVVAVNAKLSRRPGLVNESPYDRGWMIELAPTSLNRELRNLLKGVVAERWEEAVRAELVRWFTPRLEAVLQDGGGVIDNVSELVSDERWERLVHQFFPVVAPTCINWN
jgi:glycine cleavage system H protein